MKKHISSIQDLEEFARELIGVEPRFSEAARVGGALRLRQVDSGFLALVEMIISQQVSVAASDAIIARMKENNLYSVKTIIAATPDQLRKCGVSPQKSGYLKALATSLIDFDILHECDDSTIMERLTAIRGIGTWTAEIYLMFALGRRDVFPAGDLALKEASRMLLDLPARPAEKDLRKIADDWRPNRTAAAYLLWNYYRIMKQREGIRG